MFMFLHAVLAVSTATFSYSKKKNKYKKSRRFRIGNRPGDKFGAINKARTLR